MRPLSPPPLRRALLALALLCDAPLGSTLAASVRPLSLAHPSAPLARLSLPRAVRNAPARARMVATSAAVSTEEPDDGRLPYVLSGLPRSTFRGTAMGWLHKTRVWYLIASLYFACTTGLSYRSQASLSVVQLGFRALAALATAGNVFVSDRYHNADLRLNAGRPQAYGKKAESAALAFDYIGISSVLTTQLWLWSSNLNWMLSLKLVRSS